jgi:LmbE family N-acetylglucosaminyl deacetylase
MPSNAVTNIYLSPHPDDAVFSCGGMIHRQVESGGRVVVVTVCTGDPPSGPLSDFAQSLHERWRPETRTLGAGIVAVRRREDLAALDALGAQAVHLDVPDCIYRLNPASGLPLYASEAALVGSLHPSELALIRRTATKLATLLHGFGRHHLYVPLGVGQHVDHQLTRRAAEVAGGVFAYYEDYPYVAMGAERWSGPESPGPHGRTLNPELIYLAEADLCARVESMALYESQLSSFWASRQNLEESVRQFTSRVGKQAPAERIWKVA